MIGALLIAVALVLGSVSLGRALMALFGWERPTWLGGAVGFAALVTVAPLAIRLPGRGLTAAIVLALAVIAASVVVRRNVPPSSAGPRDPGAVRAPHLTALVVVLVTLALACLPFVFNEREGILGEGIYTNDQAAQLYWADWLQNGFGPRPKAVGFGYPVGPQALAAAAADGTGAGLDSAFNGLLLAIPVLTALAALAALEALPPVRRAIAASLAGTSYLGASFLAQSGFKETAMGMFVLALGIALHTGARKGRPAVATALVVALLAAAAVFTFSVPGVAWFAIAVPAFIAALLLTGEIRFDRTAVRGWLSDHRRTLLIVAGLASVALVAVIGPATAFLAKIDDVQQSSGRLSSPVFPGEALGIWPEGDFRIVRGDVAGSLPAVAFAAICAGLAAWALLRRREWGLLAALGAAAFVYALARPLAAIHVEAKALMVLAPIVMLVTLRWLLEPGTGDRSPAAVARLVAGAAFVVLAAGSTLLALRATPVGFEQRSKGLEKLAKGIDHEPVIFLGLDRYAAYWLRGTLIESPGGYVPPEVKARKAKAWQQGSGIDFDTVKPKRLDRFKYAITTAAAYQSTPPPNWHKAGEEEDYVLYRRDGPTPDSEVLKEGGRPGAPLECPAGKPSAPAGFSTALVLGAPVAGDSWGRSFPFDAPATLSTTLRLPQGHWLLSLQYHSQVPLQISTRDEDKELPPSLDGFYLDGAGRGAFWPAGEVTSSGGTVNVTVEAQKPGGFQRALGVERRVWLGTLAASPQTEPAQLPLRQACGRYVDRLLR